MQSRRCRFCHDLFRPGLVLSWVVLLGMRIGVRIASILPSSSTKPLHICCVIRRSVGSTERRSFYQAFRQSNGLSQRSVACSSRNPAADGVSLDRRRNHASTRTAIAKALSDCVTIAYKKDAQTRHGSRRQRLPSPSVNTTTAASLTAHSSGGRPVCRHRQNACPHQASRLAHLPPGRPPGPPRNSPIAETISSRVLPRPRQTCL
jgi:hypothetical protein